LIVRVGGVSQYSVQVISDCLETGTRIV
jgi:hypothetical protein